MAGLDFGAMPVTIDEQIAEVERELKMRAKVYPHWVTTGKLTQTAANLHVDRMKAVLETLKGLKR